MDELEQHKADLLAISEQMKRFYTSGQKVKIYHGSTNSTRAQSFKKDELIDISRLDRIFEVSSSDKWVIVEPNVPMDRLVEETLKHGLVPPVVMEFPGITVGGGIQGGAGESSSFKFGMFNECCFEYEMVLGNGDIVTVSPNENRDLYLGTAASYGTLGIITLIKLRLIPAKEFIRLRYRVTDSLEQAVSSVSATTSEPVDFVDGIIFNAHRGVIMTGTFSDLSDLPISTFRNRTDEWFYLHASSISMKYKEYEELIPIRDYFFRYDRGGFWVGRHAFTILKMPYIKLWRSMLDRAFRTRALYRFLHETNLSQTYFTQDLSLPEENALEFLRYVDKELSIYPIWLCPIRPGNEYEFSPAKINTKMIIDIGVWGEVKKKNYTDFLRVNRSVEGEVMRLLGRKILYAHSYYSSEEFWQIYDRGWYEAIRKKYYADTVFPDIFDKIKVTGRYKSSILKGIWRAVRQPKLPIQS